MKQDVVRQVTGMSVVFMLQSTVRGWEGFQFKWMLSFTFGGLVGLSVIGGISDPTVPVPWLYPKFFGRNSNFNI